MKRIVVILCLMFIYTNKIFLMPRVSFEEDKKTFDTAESAEKKDSVPDAFADGMKEALGQAMEKLSDGRPTTPPLHPEFRVVAGDIADLTASFLLHIRYMKSGNLEILSKEDWRMLGVLSVFFAVFSIWGKDIAVKLILIPFCPPTLVKLLSPIPIYVLGSVSTMCFIVSAYSAYLSYNRKPEVCYE